MENVVINGIAYDVLASHTADEAEARGLVNVALMMREQGRTRQLTVRRPKGKVVYFVAEFATPYGVKLELRTRVS